MKKIVDITGWMCYNTLNHSMEYYAVWLMDIEVSSEGGAVYGGKA